MLEPGKRRYAIGAVALAAALGAPVALWARSEGPLLVAVAAANTTPPPALEGAQAAEAQAERDVIFTLLACQVAVADWQAEGGGDGLRGHNVAAVLVDAEGRILAGARNDGRR